jgi:hypothetical protein
MVVVQESNGWNTTPESRWKLIGIPMLLIMTKEKMLLLLFNLLLWKTLSSHCVAMA